MGLARTPPQVVYPRSTFITPTPQGAGANPRQPPALSGAPRALPPPVNLLVEPVTPVKADNVPSAPHRSSSSKPDHQPASSQSAPGDLSFTPLSARVTPVAAARPIIAPSENGPLNAHINSLNKQLAELEAQKKDLNARVMESEKKLGEEIASRERKIEDLYDQHEREKQEWKELFNTAQAVHNIAHQQAKYELEQERLAAMNLESRLLQQNVRILVRDHSLTKFQVHEAQQGKESFVYQDQLHATKQDLEDAQKVIEKIQQQRDKERADYKESFKALKSQLDQERKIRSSAESGKGTLEGANAELASDLERAKGDLAAAQARIKELQDGATEAKSTQKTLEKSRAKYESEIEKLNGRIESLELEQEAAKEKITELEKQNRSLEKERDKRVKAEVETKALQKQISELAAGNAKESQKAVKDLETKLARAQTQAEEAQDALKTTEARVNMLEKKLASSKDVPAPAASKPAPTKDKGKQKEKVHEPPAVDLSPNSKSSDQAVEELVFTDLSDDDGDDDDDVQLIPPSPEPVRSQPKSQPKPQPKTQSKSTASSSSNPPAVAPERPKARPKMRPPPKSPSPPPRSQRPEPQVIDDDDDDEIVVEPAPVKSKPRPKMRPPPEPSPPPAPKPAPEPKGSAKGKQNIVVDSDVDELQSPPPPTKAKARAAPTKEKAPAKEKEKAKAKPKEKEKEKEKAASSSKSKRPIDDEPEVGDGVVAKKKKRKLISTDAPDLDWGAGANWLDPLGIPTTLSPIRDKEKVPRHRPGRI